MKKTISPSPVKRSSVPSKRLIRSPSAAWYSREQPSAPPARPSQRTAEAAQVAEEDSDLAAVTFEEGFVARRHDDVDDLRRQEPLQTPDPLQLLDLLADASLQDPVPLAELRRLRLDRVVVLLDTQQRADARGAPFDRTA